eukprot:10029185-Heterocapsa_arctica.AAC.1
MAAALMEGKEKEHIRERERTNKGKGKGRRVEAEGWNQSLCNYLRTLESFDLGEGLRSLALKNLANTQNVKFLVLNDYRTGLYWAAGLVTPRQNFQGRSSLATRRSSVYQPPTRHTVAFPCGATRRTKNTRVFFIL